MVLVEVWVVETYLLNRFRRYVGLDYVETEKFISVEKKEKERFARTLKAYVEKIKEKEI